MEGRSGEGRLCCWCPALAWAGGKPSGEGSVWRLPTLPDTAEVHTSLWPLSFLHVHIVTSTDGGHMRAPAGPCTCWPERVKEKSEQHSLPPPHSKPYLCCSSQSLGDACIPASSQICNASNHAVHPRSLSATPFSWAHDFLF